MAVAYVQLTHEEYKKLEAQMKEFQETTHTSVPGPFYHKSIRLRITNDLIMEFHGPNVRGLKDSEAAEKRKSIKMSSSYLNPKGDI